MTGATNDGAEEMGDEPEKLVDSMKATDSSDATESGKVIEPKSTASPAQKPQEKPKAVPDSPLSDASGVLRELTKHVLTLTASFLIIFGAGLGLEKLVDLLVYLGWVTEGRFTDLIGSRSLGAFFAVFVHSFLYWIMEAAAGVLVIGDAFLLAGLVIKLFMRAIKRL